MSSIVIGVIAALVGLFFCFRGITAMRIVIALWGAFVGFVVGAGITAAVTDTGYLERPAGWIVGVLAAIVCGTLAYLFYVIAVVLAMGSIGYTLGAAVMLAFGVSANWAVIAVGAVAGVLLAIVTITLDLPAILLIVVSAFGGATAAVGGVMLLVGTLHLDDFSQPAVTSAIRDDWWWSAAYLVLAIAGLVVQSRLVTPERDGARNAW
ncbi:DUF4203 domain-containing protein [Gordonia shandongensis]|uniref:TM7S3/TM198-like domain-containing protein n=1 Tax=Gordonia shandongensis TaxID=376351 RepID=UPI0003FD61FC|nr:DUF4203 domain-containing protein [Gordonia shandongensis]